SRAIKYRVLVSFARRLGMPRILTDMQVLPLMLSERTRREKPELAERLVRAANGFPREGTARATIAVAVRRKDILQRIDGIRAPTLVICGKEDRALEPAHSERIAQRIPGARLVLIDGAGHLSALEQPARVNEVLVPFVREHVERG